MYFLRGGLRRQTEKLKGVIQFNNNQNKQTKTLKKNKNKNQEKKTKTKTVE